MTKILLISMPFEDADIMTGNKYHMKDTDAYWLGGGYLQSYLEEKGHDVRIMSMNHNPNALEDIMETFDVWGVPGMVAVSILTFNRTSSFQLIEWLHDNYPQIIITVGGIHATVCYDQILRKYPYVIVVRGEGEITMEELAENPPLQLVEGIAYVRQGEVVLTPPRPLIKDLDMLPLPNHKHFHENADRNAANMITSRGCPNRCSFCCLNPTSGTTVRFRSVKNTVDEIEYIYRNLTNVKIIQFCDDAFFTRPSRVIEICDEIVRRGIKLRYTAQARAKPCTPEMAQAMKRAGFYFVIIGMESGDDGILKKCHKNFTVADLERTNRIFAEVGLPVFQLMIVGLPGETWDTVKRTGETIQRFQKENYNYYAAPNIAMVFPGTELAEEMVKAGRLTEDYWMTNGMTPTYTVEHSEAELKAMQEELLDYVCCDRLWTRGGFGKQWHLIPQIYWYKFWHFWWPRHVSGELVW